MKTVTVGDFVPSAGFDFGELEGELVPLVLGPIKVRGPCWRCHEQQVTFRLESLGDGQGRATFACAACGGSWKSEGTMTGPHWDKEPPK